MLPGLRSGVRLSLRATLIVVIVAGVVGEGHARARQSITLEERVALQREIERVYWNNRIWPAGNTSSKPPLEAVLSESALRDRVEDGLRQSDALDRLWHHRLTPTDLQGEVDRMVRNSRAATTLAVLFHSLNDDPSLIAECLGRPHLTNRLIRGWYATDARLHGATRAAATAALRRNQSFEHLARASGTYDERVIRRRPATDEARADPALPLLDSAELVDEGAWDALVRETSAGSAPLRLEEDESSFFVRVVEWTNPGSIAVRTVRWRKTPFDEWWREARYNFEPRVEDVAATYRVPRSVSSSCVDDTWASTRWGPPSARFGHKAVWTGSEMIVWGGDDGVSIDHNTISGGRYDPATDEWTPTPVIDGNWLYSRIDFSAVWTGTEMIVWGGYSNSGGFQNTGGRYDPQVDRWTATVVNGATPTQRSNHTAVWTGTEMIVWGGTAVGVGLMNSGARYNPATDSWTPTSVTGQTASPRYDHTAVWTNGKMIVWGGTTGNPLNTGAIYNPANDSWTAMTTTGAPDPRTAHTAVWGSGEMIVWGGLGVSGNLRSGGRFKLSTSSWTATSITGNTPPALSKHAAVWTGTEMIVWGGGFTTGGRYNPAANTWSTMSTANAPSGGTAVWTGSVMIMWGGTSSGRVNTGARYNPATNTWAPTRSSTPGMPAPGGGHVAIWTGAEMIVSRGTTSRYDPATDDWTYASAAGAPSSRTYACAVWTGREVIVWGGFPTTNTGARYDPTLDSWTATNTGPNLPDARYACAAVWDGIRLLVWGGYSPTAGYPPDGGRYTPASDSWQAISAGAAAPSGRASFSVVWTGTEMIVWGGANASGSLQDGGRYDPVSDSWNPAGIVNSGLSPRYAHSAIWSGTEMIVWGGRDGPYGGNDGSRYNPVSNQWNLLGSDPLTPGARWGHSVAWTGTEMIVWGGNTRTGSAQVLTPTGGRFDPAINTWLATATGLHHPSAREGQTAIWTGGTMIVWGGTADYGTDDLGALDTGSAYCAGPCGSPPAVSLVSVHRESGTGSRIEWEATAGAVAYDIVRGDLGILRASAGDFATGTTGCVAEQTNAMSAFDSTVAAPGNGVWYLVRARACAGGTYDGGGSQVGSRDAEIAAASVACP